MSMVNEKNENFMNLIPIMEHIFHNISSLNISSNKLRNFLAPLVVGISLW